MTGLSIAVYSFLVFVIALVAFHFRLPLKDEADPKLVAVLRSLLVQEITHSESKRIAVGYGACQDLFIDGKLLLKDKVPPVITNHYNEIGNEKELLEMYGYFFRHGAAAERFISNADYFDHLVEEALKLPTHRWALGGNAPVMALRFAKLGGEVLLAGKMTEAMKKTLPNKIQLSSQGYVTKDDIHLILEYKRNEKWGQFVSPRANRFIVHSDVNNPTISSLEEFEGLLHSFSPDLFVISGLQMMDNFPFKDGERMKRLKMVQAQMKKQSLAKTRIHFEMASFVDELLFNELISHVIPFADSLGMNEQELPNLHAMLKYGNISYVSDSNPRIALVLDQMREVFEILRSRPSSNGSGVLTRMHIHTLAYQVIMTKRNSPWNNTKAAAAGASLTANRHVCASPEVDLDKAFIIMDDSFTTSAGSGGQRIPFNQNLAISCWTEKELDVEVCIAPNLVCSDAKQTCGGGDNISAAGLYPQI